MVRARKIIDKTSNTVTLSKTFFDISHLISENISVYPGDPKPEFDKISTIESDKVEVTKITMGSHTGTHIDAKRHFIADATGIDKEPLRKFIGQAQEIDFSKKPKVKA